MNDHQFQTTEDNAQLSAIWEEGTFLTERHQGFHNIKLYQLQDCYAEVTYHSHFNVVLKVATFTETDYLEPYLKEIDISSLLNN